MVKQKKSMSLLSLDVKKELLITFRCSPPEMFLRKSALRICSKLTRDHACRSMNRAFSIRNTTAENNVLWFQLQNCKDKKYLMCLQNLV